MGIRTELSTKNGFIELGKIYFQEGIEGIEFWQNDNSTKLEIYDSGEILQLLDGIIDGTIKPTELFDDNAYLPDYKTSDFVEFRDWIKEQGDEVIQGFVG